MKKLLKFLIYQAPKLVFLAMIASIISGLMNTALLALINQGVTSLGKAPPMVFWGFIAALVGMPLSRVIAQVLMVNLTQRTIFDLRIHLAAKILGAPLRTLEKKGANKLLAALTDDINSLSQSLSMVPMFFMHLAITTSVFGYLFWLHWQITLLLILAALLGIFLSLVMGAKANGFFKLARNEQDVLYQRYMELTQGTKELKLNRDRRKDYTDVKLSGTAEANKRHNILGTAWFTVSATVSHLLFFLVVGLIVFFAPNYWSNLSVEILFAFVVVVLYLLIPLEAVVSLAPTFSRALVSVHKIEDLGISLEKETVEPSEVTPVKPDWHKLEYRGITHTYYREREDENFAMGPMDLVFEPGELVFIVGGNGSGKTTLAKLLVGLYYPESGEILMDGNKVTNENRDAFRQKFSAVFTDFFLFDTLMGIPSERLEERAGFYLKKLLLHHKVKIEGDALSTIDLSQGQRKRLALLTAFLEDRSIYLFDEWAADQDPQFKEIFYKVLLPELQARNKTVIVISHDDHYFHMANRIVKLDYGQIEFDKPIGDLVTETGLTPTVARETRRDSGS